MKTIRIEGEVSNKVAERVANWYEIWQVVIDFPMQGNRSSFILWGEEEVDDWDKEMSEFIRNARIEILPD